MKSNILLIILSIFIISLIITLNFFLQQNYQAEMAEQFSRQQLLLTTTVSRNIESHLAHLKEETSTLASLLSHRNLKDPGIGEFITDAFEEVREEYGVTLRVYDSGGGLRFSTLDMPAEGNEAPLLRETRASTGGKPVIREMTEQGRMVTMALPITADGAWQGAVIVDISLDFINSKFLAPIRSGEKGYAWMMDSEGTLLYHPTQPSMMGKNLNRADPSCFECHKSFDVEKWILESGEIGSKSYIAPMGEDKLIAFSKADIFDAQWIILVSIPYSEITASIRKSMRLHSVLVISIFCAAVLGAFTIIMINRKRIKAEEKARHEEELERYANELEAMVESRTRELSTEKEKLNTIVNAVGGGLILMGKGGRIQWANQVVHDMAGRDVIGMYCEELWPDCMFIDSYVSDNLETTIMENLFGKQGRSFQVTTAPVKSNDEIIGHIRLIQDVTDMKKVEEQMAHSEKLASVGRLTAGIAHEIGNPLTSVFSFLQILREKETDDFKMESMDTVLFHIRRIADIVRQLSGLSKLPPSERKETDINDLVESSLGLLTYDKRAKQITVERKYAESVPSIVTDGNQLSQVFVNLILNAVDAMPDGGTLTIRTKRLTQAVAVEFEDTGTGIPKEHVSKLFDPFFTTKDKGTGLGLSVSYGIVKRLGGDIVVESKEGRGTTFTIKLPLSGA